MAQALQNANDVDGPHSEGRPKSPSRAAIETEMCLGNPTTAFDIRRFNCGYW